MVFGSGHPAMMAFWIIDSEASNLEPSIADSTFLNFEPDSALSEMVKFNSEPSKTAESDLALSIFG